MGHSRPSGSKKKIFAMVARERGSTTASMKASRQDQAAMLAEGAPFFYPAYVGSKGWIGVDLRAPALDWGEVAEIVHQSYRLVAPRRLSVGLD